MDETTQPLQFVRPQETSGDNLAELRASLVRVVRRICPAWLVDRREDLVQAAVTKIWLGQRESGEGIVERSSSYLYRVAHSALVDEIRRLRRLREVALEDGGETVERKESDEDPERRATSRSIGRAIASCLGDMKAERRKAVALYLQGHSVPESSRFLGWDRKRTENLVFRGLADLRQCLMKKGVQP